MLRRSSIINKIVINIMIVEVMYKAKLPHSFVDSRPRDDIDRIRGLVGYRVSQARRMTYRVYLETIDALGCHDYRSYGQSIVAPSLTSSTE